MRLVYYRRPSNCRQSPAHATLSRPERRIHAITSSTVAVPLPTGSTPCMSPNPSIMSNVSSLNVLRGCSCQGFAATPKAYSASCRKREKDTVIVGQRMMRAIVGGLICLPHGNTQPPNGLHFVAGRPAGADPVAVTDFARTLIPTSLQFGAELLSGLCDAR